MNEWGFLKKNVATGNQKKVTINEFEGKLLVHIRHFYEDRTTGEEKPGKNGIALSVDQWNKLKEQVLYTILKIFF